MKPGAKSRGRGITVQSRIMDILRSYVGTGEPNLQKDGRWVIQKYIERPLLIHETKFDIRQWFMIDSFSPLKIWSYLDSYLRFSSRPFSLIDHNQAIHLCNYSIQKNYDDQSQPGQRNPELPEDNMWTNSQFDSWYYERFDCASIWQDQVWPQMIDIMTKVMLSALESGNMENAGKLKSSFELYGADFMLTIGPKGKLKVWLIELNSSPTMALSSSQATHKLCRSVQEDTIDLILSDTKNMASEGTRIGGYELTHHAKYSQRIPSYNGQPMSLEATAIKKPREPRKPRMFRIPGESFRRSLDGKKIEAVDGSDSPEGFEDSDSRKEIPEEKTLETEDGEETSSKNFARRLALRKVSATRSSENTSVQETAGGLTSRTNLNTPEYSGGGNISFSKQRRKTRINGKVLPRIDKPLVPQREVHMAGKSGEKRHHFRKLPVRRTPMAVALCTSQHDLSTRGKPLIVSDDRGRTMVAESAPPTLERTKTVGGKERSLEQDMVKILAAARSKNEAVEKLANIPFLLKSNHKPPQQYSISPQLHSKTSTTLVDSHNGRNAISQTSNPDLNYSLHVNGAKQKRMKTYIIDPKKYLSRTMTDPTRLPMSRSSYTKIPVATAGELPSRKQKQVSVVDMTSYLHSGTRPRHPSKLTRSKYKLTNFGSSMQSTNYKDFGVAKVQNRLGADYFWMNPH